MRQGHGYDFCPLESLESNRRSKIEREREKEKKVRNEGVQGQREWLFLSEKKVMKPLRISHLC